MEKNKFVSLEELKNYLEIHIKKVGAEKAQNGKLPPEKTELMNVLLDIYLFADGKIQNNGI